MRNWICLSTYLAVLMMFAAPLLADPPEHSDKSTDDNLSVTHHSINIHGQSLDYTATTGTMMLKSEDNKPQAAFFFVAYTKDGSPAATQPSTEPSTEPSALPSTRPITFVFNGGPGAAAVFLHLGAAGPKRVQLGPDGLPGAPPHRLIDNDQTWLDTTDLVFIDPVGTGYSRAAEGQKPQDFFGVDNDIESVGDFIRLYLTRYQRWQSPKFLAGESYGTTRAAGLSEHLLDSYGIDLNGIILISSVLNFETLEPDAGNELPYALYLPSYTAVAIAHHKIFTSDEDGLLAEVQKFAIDQYLPALSRGSNMDPADRTALAAKLSAYTGLPAALIDQANLRIDPEFFRKHLLSDEGKIIGRYDARITGLDPHPAEPGIGFDPSASLFLPVYSGTFNQYVRHDLKFDSDLPYEVLSDQVGPWSFGHDGQGGDRGMGYLDVTGALRAAMLQNPHLKVLVCAGYEDLATPFLAANYTFNHLDLTGRLRANITQTYYHSGHMIYHDPIALPKLKHDVAAFINMASDSH